MSSLVQTQVKVYHATTRANLAGIMAEGLKPLAKNRPRGLQLADFAFDAVAGADGVTHRRTGVFAWPDRNKACLLHSDSAILEVTADSRTALVFHQAWIDLAWGIMETVLSAVNSGYKEWAAHANPRDVLDQLGQAQLSEGCLADVLSSLARSYWRSGVTLAEYNPESARAMTEQVIQQQARFSGLMPGLDHEVALGSETIPRERFELVTD